MHGAAKCKFFEHAGALLTADGSDDDKIKLEGAPKGYTLSIPSPPAADAAARPRLPPPRHPPQLKYYIITQRFHGGFMAMAAGRGVKKPYLGGAAALETLRNLHLGRPILFS